MSVSTRLFCARSLTPPAASTCRMQGAGGDGAGVQMSGKSGLIDENNQLKLTGTSKI